MFCFRHQQNHPKNDVFFSRCTDFDISHQECSWVLFCFHLTQMNPSTGMVNGWMPKENFWSKDLAPLEKKTGRGRGSTAPSAGLSRRAVFFQILCPSVETPEARLMPSPQSGRFTQRSSGRGVPGPIFFALCARLNFFPCFGRFSRGVGNTVGQQQIGRHSKAPRSENVFWPSCNFGWMVSVVIFIIQGVLVFSYHQKFLVHSSAFLPVTNISRNGVYFLISSDKVFFSRDNHSLFILIDVMHRGA